MRNGRQHRLLHRVLGLLVAVQRRVHGLRQQHQPRVIARAAVVAGVKLCACLGPLSCGRVIRGLLHATTQIRLGGAGLAQQRLNAGDVRSLTVVAGA